ncbi:MAG TPA: hypothetical protein VLD84_04105 [Nitrososphaeraceae archaeon]|nr:hypothetical protein [Nitrososphaeraceae archaeon]
METVFSPLKKLGITEFYAPTDGKPMSVVISANNSKKINCQIGDQVGSEALLK